MTRVVNLRRKEEEFIYNLPPEKAVKAAYLQWTMKNWNTWDYDKIDVTITVGEKTVCCGDFCALRDE